MGIGANALLQQQTEAETPVSRHAENADLGYHSCSKTINHVIGQSNCWQATHNNICPPTERAAVAVLKEKTAVTSALGSTAATELRDTD